MHHRRRHGEGVLERIGRLGCFMGTSFLRLPGWFIGNLRALGVLWKLLGTLWESLGECLKGLGGFLQLVEDPSLSRHLGAFGAHVEDFWNRLGSFGAHSSMNHDMP